MNKRIIRYFTIVFTMNIIHAQNTEAPSWVDFAEKKLTDNLAEATLSDYSYAGYHFSEKKIPNVSSWNTLSVIDYGAVADDLGYDDAGIQAAINAAEASGLPTVVYFPAGRYMVSSTTTENAPITIRNSNIVLKGAGSAAGGTEIYTDKFGDMPYRFQVEPTDVTSTDITNITSEIKKSDFEVQVTSTNGLTVGQSVDLYQKNQNNLAANMSGLTYNSVWTPIINNGIRPYEKHIITAISGNKVTFKNPIQLNMPVHSSTVLRTYNTIEEVGVEDILFTSGWKHYPEDYLHHANEIVDYAWRAIYFGNVKNGWVKNCHFKDWNEVMQIEKSIAVTVKDIKISGKKGHTGYYSRYSYGVLFENCEDIADEGLSRDSVKGMGHGPGMRWSTTSTVFLNCTMQKHQSIDCHGYHPYGNLLDNVVGGTVRGNGGAENAYPNSGPYLTFWNFKHDSNYSNKEFNFWDYVTRRTHTLAYPLFVGFQDGSGETIEFKNEGLDELRGKQVYPNSLFEAQLQLRLYGGYMSSSSSKIGFSAKLANDGETTTYWESEGIGAGQWLMLDLGVNKTISEIIIKEQSSKIKDWNIEYWDATEWKELTTGSGIGAEKNIAFDVVTARKLRLNIQSMLAEKESSTASIVEFKIVPGPLLLAADNFTIETIGETCLDKKNGKVIINASVAHDYIATINGATYNFANTLTVESLTSGIYELCIEVDGEDYEQCYQITIEGGVNLIGKMQVVKQLMQVSVESGAPPYSVYKNGEQIMETYQSRFSLDVNHGDNFQIKSKDACQGEMLKVINLLESVKAYPNPSNGVFEIYLPKNLKTVDVAIYNIHSQLIDVKAYALYAGKVQLNIKDKPNGIYFAKVNLEKPIFLKLIKK